MSTDLTALLRRGNPVGDVDRYDDQRTAELLDRATEPRTGPRRRRRGPRAVAAGVGAGVVLAGGGGLAWAVVTRSADTAQKVQCAATVDRADWDPAEADGFGLQLPSFSGDPVADCAGEYQRLTGHTPELVAYDTGRVYIAVVPAGWPVPEDWAPLQPGFQNDPVRLELAHRLDDLVEGPQASCSTADQAEAVARTELADLRLTGWRIERLPEAVRADGTDWCAVAWVDEGPLPEITIQGVEGGVSDATGTEPVRRVVDTLRTGVARSCLPLAEAVEHTEQAITANGWSLADAKVTAIEDPAATCSRVDLVPGGLVTVVLRGPTG